jgi:pilus assembly protein CpaE
VSSVLLASGSPELARKFRMASGDELTVINPVQLPAGPAQLLGLAADDELRVVALDVRDGQVDATRAMDLSKRIEEGHPGVAVLLVHDHADALGLAALRSGVYDVIGPDSAVDDLRVILRGAEDAAIRRVEGISAPTNEHSGRVICVASPKGGVGKTTLATNIALGLAAQSPQGTVLVDVDVQFGDIAAALDIEPTYTVADMLTPGTVPDPIGLKALLTQHSSGLQVVPGVQSPVEADRITPEAVSTLLMALKSEFRYVVVDTAPGLSAQTLAVLDHTTDLVLVTSLDVPGVRGLRKELDVLDQLELPPATQQIVLNFVDRAGGLSVADVEDALGRKVDLTLPRSRRVVLSTNQGHPMVASLPRDRVSRDILAFVQRFSPLVAGQAGLSGRHRGWRNA